jgi:hypothetical protein
LVVVAMSLSMHAWAETFDWRSAEKGIPFESTVAFSGCTPSASLSDQRAYKIALLRAQTNMTRTRNIEVSGEEHMATGLQGTTEYKKTIVETAEDFIQPLVVVNQQLTVLDKVEYLCLLVVERSKKEGSS